MPGCTAPNCSNSSQKGYKLYHFPSDEERNRIWVENCGREKGWKATKHTCICEVHFEEDQFESHRADGLRKLKPYAIPTIFNSEPKLRKYSQKKGRKVKKGVDEALQEENVNVIRTKNEKLYTGRRRTNLSTLCQDEPLEVVHSPVRKSARILLRGCRKWTGINDVSEEDQEDSTAELEKVMLSDQSATSCCVLCNRMVKGGTLLCSPMSASKTLFYEKLCNIVVVEKDLQVQRDGILCPLCTRLLSYMDCIEVQLSALRKTMVDCILKKYKCDGAYEDRDLSGEMEKFVSLAANMENDRTSAKLISEWEESLPYTTTNCSHSEEDKASQQTEEEDMQEPDSTLFKCLICGYKTMYKSVIVFHLRQHVKNTFRCDFCNLHIKQSCATAGQAYEGTRVLCDAIVENCVVGDVIEVETTETSLVHEHNVDLQTDSAHQNRPQLGEELFSYTCDKSTCTG